MRSRRGQSNPPDDAVSLVLLPELEWQQMKSKWFEALESAGVMIEAKAVTRDELPEWLADRLSRQDQRASVETLEWLADRVEGNLLAAKQEVEKLGLLLPRGEVSLDAIRDAVTDVSRFERDTLIEAIHSGDTGRVVRAVDSLEAEGEPLPLLLWTLAEELRLADGDLVGAASPALFAARPHGRARQDGKETFTCELRPGTLAGPCDRPHD